MNQALTNTLQDLRHAFASCVNRRDSRPPRSLRSRSASAPTPRSSRWCRAFCCVRFRLPIQRCSIASATPTIAASMADSSERTATSISSPTISYQHLKESAPEFESLAAMQAGQWQWSVRRGNTLPRELHGEFVTGNYFSTLGVGSFAGRVFNDTDDQPTSFAGGRAQLSLLAE